MRFLVAAASGEEVRSVLQKVGANGVQQDYAGDFRGAPGRGLARCRDGFSGERSLHHGRLRLKRDVHEPEGRIVGVRISEDTEHTR